jgi:hypothetical protein
MARTNMVGNNERVLRHQQQLSPHRQPRGRSSAVSWPQDIAIVLLVSSSSAFGFRALSPVSLNHRNYRLTSPSSLSAQQDGFKVLRNALKKTLVPNTKDIIPTELPPKEEIVDTATTEAVKAAPATAVVSPPPNSAVEVAEKAVAAKGASVSTTATTVPAKVAEKTAITKAAVASKTVAVAKTAAVATSPSWFGGPSAAGSKPSATAAATVAKKAAVTKVAAASSLVTAPRLDTIGSSAAHGDNAPLSREVVIKAMRANYESYMGQYVESPRGGTAPSFVDYMKSNLFSGKAEGGAEAQERLNAMMIQLQSNWNSMVMDATGGKGSQISFPAAALVNSYRNLGEALRSSESWSSGKVIEALDLPTLGGWYLCATAVLVVLATTVKSSGKASDPNATLVKATTRVESLETGSGVPELTAKMDLQVRELIAASGLMSDQLKELQAEKAELTTQMSAMKAELQSVQNQLNGGKALERSLRAELAAAEKATKGTNDEIRVELSARAKAETELRMQLNKLQQELDESAVMVAEVTRKAEADAKTFEKEKAVIVQERVGVGSL